MMKEFKLVRLSDCVLVEIESDNPVEDAGRILSFLQKYGERFEGSVPLFRDEEGRVILGVDEDKGIPLPREAVKTLYKTPTLVLAIGDNAVAEEIARFNLAPEVILRELL